MNHEPRPAIHMVKKSGWASNLGGTESLGISKVDQTVLPRLMESQICHLLANSVALFGEALEKGQWHQLPCMPDTSIFPYMSLVLSSCYAGAGARRE